MKKYRCYCDVEFDTIKQAVAHCRKEHPNRGWSCVDQFGTTGDAFADSAVETLRAHLRESGNELSQAKAELSTVKKAWDELLAEHDRVKAIAIALDYERRIHIVRLAVEFPDASTGTLRDK